MRPFRECTWGKAKRGHHRPLTLKRGGEWISLLDGGVVRVERLDFAGCFRGQHDNGLALGQRTALELAQDDGAPVVVTVQHLLRFKDSYGKKSSKDKSKREQEII